jgi:two-component system CheB/CheR fusion protein
LCHGEEEIQGSGEDRCFSTYNCGRHWGPGGIEALREFFAEVPVDLGLAYVVVVHLAPDHESELAAILARRTSMTVVEVDDSKQLELQPNAIYVIAPDRNLEICRNGAV